ncbi:MAG: MerR family transcriptional regulator [Candidatus Omnitrophica bacterium]|nr:MerR family transcriptional regulator [Candidatus Omnitrophota bacterium]MCF7894741.1 MerR family transcriptional regulator [Candidatus Omnitrophota bacterium]
MKWDELEKQFDLDIPLDEPIFPVNIVCKLLDMQYYLLHEIVKEGILKEEKKKKKKLFSLKDMKQLKYIKHLVEDEGVNIKGVKVILEVKEEE